MSSMFTCAIFVLVAMSSACRSTSSTLQSEHVDYKDRIVFSWSVAPRNVSIQIKNLGPGPVLASLELRDGATTKQELAEGEAPYFMLQNLTRVEFFHAAAGRAAVEWTIPVDLHSEVDVRAE